MRKSKESNRSSEELNYALAVDITGLMKLLGCGRDTAKSIGERSHARVVLGTKRILYSVEKVKEYLYTTSE